MAKRRTRKQKEQARYNFTVSWNPDSFIKREAGNESHEAAVKGQFENAKAIKSKLELESKKPKATVKPDQLASVKKDIFKSLILASLIIASEIVLYLFLPTK